MKSYSESEIIKGIKDDDSEVLRFVYRNYFPYVESYIHQHGGTNEQAEDVFQEVMIILYKNIKSGRLTLTCKLSTYLYAICKNVWMQQNRKHSIKKTSYQGDIRVAEPEPSYTGRHSEEIMEIYERNFESLSPDCRQILKLYFNDFKNEEIRKIMDFKSVAQVVDRKYRCKKTLIERIHKDPKFIRSNNEKRK